MTYRNTKTQAVIETACVIKGGNWVPVDKKQPKNTGSRAKKDAQKKSGE